MKLQCKKCGRIVNAPVTALTDGSDCSECGGSFKIPSDKSLSIGKYIIIVALVALVLIALFSSAYTIDAGQRGVILTWGSPSPVASVEGFHFKIPVANVVIKMDVKTQKYESDASAASKDLQVVSTKIAVNYHLVPETVPELYKTIGIHYQDRVIQPAVQEVVKASTAKFTAEELITRRAEVKEDIKSSLKERLQERGIILEDISITNFDFSQSFNEAIEAKVTAEQNALAAKNKLAQVEYEAQQRITQAEGEAKAIEIQARAIQAQGGKDYVQLQAIAKWNGVLPQVTGGVIPFLSLETNKSI